MSAIDKEATNNYLEIKDDLYAQYIEVRLRAMNVDKVNVATKVETLFEYDNLRYNCIAILSFTQSSIKPDLDTKVLLEEYITVSQRIAEKLPLADVYSEFPELSNLRRLIEQHAELGGRIACLLVESNDNKAAVCAFLEKFNNDNASQLLLQLINGQALHDNQKYQIPIDGQRRTPMQVVLANMKRNVECNLMSSAIDPYKLTNFWTSGRTSCMLLTVKYLSSLPETSRFEILLVVRNNMLTCISFILLHICQTRTTFRSIESRLVRMMELDMFEPPECIYINKILDR